jgi:hypothetical protein
MTKEIRQQFEANLQEYLKRELGHLLPDTAIILKKEIKYKLTKSNEVFADIAFEFYPKSNGYYVHMSFKSEKFKDFLEEVSPPYRSNIGEGWHFIAASWNFKKKLFGNSRGLLELARNVHDVNKMLDTVSRDLKGFFIPLANHFYCLDKELIDNISEYGDIFYSHPVLLAIFLARKNGMPIEFVNNPKIFNRRLSRNLSFDRAVAEKFLARAGNL